MKRLLPVLTILLLLPVVSFAQDDDCSTMVENVVSDVARQCADIAPGEACFGYPGIEVTTSHEMPAFEASGDKLALDKTCCMRLSPMRAPDEWGIAMMEIQPDTGEHSLTYALFGEVQIQNAASFFTELEIRVESDTAVYAGPGSHYDALATVTAGDVMHANACNCTQNWLRVRLETGDIGWVPAGRVTILGEVDSLPMADQDTPVYAAMQAFTFESSSQHPACESAPENGILVQAPAEAPDTRVWVNGVDMTITAGATLFFQAEPGTEFGIEVLAGNVTLTVEDETVTAPPGVRVSIPLSSGYTPDGHMTVVPYALSDIEYLPLALLPQVIDPAAALSDPTPLIIGQRICNVVSDLGEMACALHFVNQDGDPITSLAAEFLYAPQGEWEGSVHESPEIIEGDTVSGDLAWDVSCSLGGANFIGPVVWSITVTDAAGHVSPPFEASFNCVDG